MFAVDPFYFEDIKYIRHRRTSVRQGAQGCDFTAHVIVTLCPTDLECNVIVGVMISRQPNRCKAAGPELVYDLITAIGVHVVY
jgi:hypothetical protein